MEHLIAEQAVEEKAFGLREITGGLLMLGSSWLLWKALRSDDASRVEPESQTSVSAYRRILDHRHAEFVAAVRGEMPIEEYVKNRWEELGG
jgi:hypothetical protein